MNLSKTGTLIVMLVGILETLVYIGHLLLMIMLSLLLEKKKVVKKYFSIMLKESYGC